MVHMLDVVVIAAALVVFVILVSLLSSLLISFLGIHLAQKKHKEQLNAAANLLPNIDCGECGYSCCRSFADALLCQEACVDSCPHCQENVKEQLRNSVIQANPASQELPKNLRQRKKKLRIWDDPDAE